MRVLALTSGLLLISGVYGLNVFEVQAPLSDSKPYWTDYSQAKMHQSPENIKAFGAPMTSQASPGKVVTMTAPNYLAINMLVIGHDDASKQWLMSHQKYLTHFHGLGLVANVDNEEQLAALETLAGIPLIAANVDALMRLIHQKHYPLVIEKGCVWQ